MIRGMREIAYSMQMQSDRMNVIANNISNVNTRAYKKEILNTKSFKDVMIQAMQFDGSGGKPIGPMSLGASIDEQRTVFEQGTLEETGFTTDFAIRGDGFFVIETPQGTEYTRAGNFTLNQDGYLINQKGDYVLGQKGRLQIPSKQFRVDLQGRITTETQLVDTIQVVDFTNKRALKKVGIGNYINSDPQNTMTNVNSNVLQTYIENSNVSAVEETRDLLAAKRNFESGQQIAKMLDDITGKANEIGRV